MNITRCVNYLFFQLCITISLASAGLCHANQTGNGSPSVPPAESSTPIVSALEELVLKSSPREPMDGVATYYAKRFEGRKTTSGHRYHPDKMTAAHHFLPLGTVVRVVNPDTKQEVHVTINDRCAWKPFHFIDLSRAAAKKIGLWRKGTIKVVIIPLLEEEPV
jgi:rare lipoprotein A